MITYAPVSNLLFAVLTLATCWVVQCQSDEFLSAHNGERQSLGISPLVWDDTLASYANQYALTQDNPQGDCSEPQILTHSNGPYGENLYWSRAPSTPTDAVNKWISEKQDYDYASNTCVSGQECGHYTQVVWAATLRVGCVAHACASNPGATYTICSYDPPGNYAGQRPY